MPDSDPVDSSSVSEEMRVDPQRASQLSSNLSKVLSTIHASSTTRPVRLIAVSKLKPASDILALHQPPQSSSPPPQEQQQQPRQPHVYFGENYLQELQHKAALLPRSIRWSFIGGLQTNKCSALSRVPNLWSVNSIDTRKKADALDRGRAAWVDSEEGKEALATGGEDGVEEQIGVFVQVNTSGEESKSGVPPGEEVVALCRHIREENKFLKLRGLMTIGAIARSQASAEGEENEDFVVLKRERDSVSKELGVSEEDLELSMGMSADFEEAIRLGSNEVRVGSTIFGERPPKGGSS